MIRPRRNHARLARIDIIPDIEERMREIVTNPVRLGYFLGIRHLVGEGHDQFVDDMLWARRPTAATSPNGPRPDRS